MLRCDMIHNSELCCQSYLAVAFEADLDVHKLALGACYKTF
jgi:hypothetical protein